MSDPTTTVTTNLTPEEIEALVARLMAAYPGGVKITSEQGLMALGQSSKTEVKGLGAVASERKRMRPGKVEYGDVVLAFHYCGLSDKESTELDKIDAILPPKKTKIERGQPMEYADFEDPNFITASAAATRRKLAKMIEMATDITIEGDDLVSKGEWLSANVPPNMINAILALIRTLSSNVLDHLNLS